MQRQVYAIICLLLATAPLTAQGNKTMARVRSTEAALLLIRDNDLDGAKKAYEDALALDTSFAQPRFNLGVIAEKRESWSEARDWYRQFVARDTGTSYGVLARVKLQVLDKLISADSTPAGRVERQYLDHVGRARFLLTVNNATEAYSEAAVAMGLLPQRSEAYVVAATALSESGAYGEAEALVRQAQANASATQRPRIDSILVMLGRRKAVDSVVAAAADQMVHDQFPAAAQLYERAWAIAPERGDLGLKAASAYALAEQQMDAERILKQIAATGSPAIAREAMMTLLQIRSLSADIRQASGRPPQ